MRLHATALTVGLLTLASGSVSAQTSDSTPFHRGQWGTNFTIGSGFAGAGFLHFSSATRALIVDVAGNYSHEDNTNGASPFFTPNSGNVSVQVGVRTYRPLARDVQRWTTIGVFGNYGRSTNVYAGPVTEKFGSVGGGAFGSLGATWSVTPHLGLGAQWTVTLGYTHSTDEFVGNPTMTTNTISLALGHLALIGQLYF